MVKSIEILDLMCQQKLDPSRIARLYTRSMDISEWVKECRKAAGLTQTELGERLGVGKANVSAWENGRHEPSYSQMLKIGAEARWVYRLPGAPGDDSWPFSGITPAEYEQLEATDKEEIAAIVRLKISRLPKSENQQVA